MTAMAMNHRRCPDYKDLGNGTNAALRLDEENKRLRQALFDISKDGCTLDAYAARKGLA